MQCIELRKIRKMALVGPAAGLLGLWIVSYVASAQELPTLGDPREERLSVSAHGELVPGETVGFEAELAIIFKVGLLSYRDLKPEITQVLVAQPRIEHPPGLQPRIVSLDAEPAAIRVMNGVGKGFSIRCKLEVSAEREIAPGEYTVAISLPAVGEIASMIEATSPLKPPIFSFHLKVYESEEARESARAAATRDAQEAKAALLRAQEEKTAAQSRRRLVIGVIIGFVVLVVVVLLGFSSRKSTFESPKYRLELKRNRSGSTNGTWHRSTTISKRNIHRRPEGQTVRKYARTFWGMKADIKIVIEATPTSREVTEITTTTESASGISKSVSYEEQVYYSLAIRATVGQNVAPGSYAASVHDTGSIVVRVQS